MQADDHGLRCLSSCLSAVSCTWFSLAVTLYCYIIGYLTFFLSCF
jgi:hypothetical protein